MNMVTPNTPIEYVPKVAKKIVSRLKKLGIHTAGDLLTYFPARYEDFSNIRKISEVAKGETVTLQVAIKNIRAIRTSRKKMIIVQAEVEDDSGRIRATWFNQPFLTRILKMGDWVNLSGKIALGSQGKYLQSPSYEKITNDKLRMTSQGIHTGGLVAIYPETRGITSRWLRFLIKNILEIREALVDPLSLDTRKKYALMEVKEAIRAIHFPRSKDEITRARRRFNFEGLLLIQLRVLQDRLAIKEYQAPVVTTDVELIKKFVSSLPFKLTDAQRRSIWEITRDISRPRPMNRILEGDVGSGKTVVAAVVSLLTVRSGFRVLCMAPTEILARQHYATFQKFLSVFNIKVGLFIGSEKVGSPVDIIVGTHALIQENSSFDELGLVVVDEQHRFGVEQRRALAVRNAVNYMPHFLSMSATPIPRTLALTIYGDLDVSLLDEMPKSRKEVITKIVEPSRRIEAYHFIREEIKRGRQAFVICPKIEVGEQDLKIGNSKHRQQKLNTVEVKAVKEEYKKLSEDVFSDLRVAMLHGKLKSREKATVMKKFERGEIDILVSTSVVEVGVDVPNATIMMIEGAERFGLAQLHQFRGRVGRGLEQSYCFLFPAEGGLVTRRLKALVEAKNGLELAEKDLAIRGSGDIFGTRQWGVSPAIFAAITDQKLVYEVRHEATEILKKDPLLTASPGLAGRLKKIREVMHGE